MRSVQSRQSAKSAIELTGVLRILVQMVIFRFVSDRDIFQKFYTAALARRLVSERSESPEAEASMISKLKETCGVDYTSKLQNMFTGEFPCGRVASDRLWLTRNELPKISN